MRKPRVLQEGARYHVTARAHHRRLIFQHVSDKQLFLEVVARAKAKFAFQLENFCLMNNHFHAMVRPKPGTNLSRIFQWILSVFAQAWNRRHGLHDSVWGSRFFSRIIAGAPAFLAIYRYIDENPVKARLVKESHEWHFGRWGLLRLRRPRGLVDQPPGDLFPAGWLGR